MTEEQRIIIAGLLAQAQDKNLLANGDADSVFMDNASTLRKAAEMIEQLATSLERATTERDKALQRIKETAANSGECDGCCYLIHTNGGEELCMRSRVVDAYGYCNSWTWNGRD